MVRLLPAHSIVCGAKNKFQSHNGAIAAKATIAVGGLPAPGFNPTMVRLLPISPFLSISCIHSFQSHNGAIAARIGRVTTIVQPMFQSHNGAIAASLSVQTLPLQGSFNPTMVRLLRKSDLKLCLELSFQSHNGAIAASCLMKRWFWQQQVSIPQWCDCCPLYMLPINPTPQCFNPTMVRLLLTARVIS